ncbi:nucleolar complex-associated protein 3 isoform X2 [Diospyros lotus]|uniref:nucleolar complex-associated protein 3 isoform X2 n=1 Tax=Diospyros lotus TaxID=55363 RepID=UPI002252DBDA|nr:nucleolar complex-associated protein 3 isoform X2 [Diospyros lotus]
MGKKQKIVLPPELPPEVSEEEIEVSDEDVQFVVQNPEYASGVSNLDTHSITRHVTRVADVKEDALESLYEKRFKKKLIEEKNEENGLEVDRVDALPVKTLDGKLYYRTVPKMSQKSENATSRDQDIVNNEADGVDKSLVKFTKAEKRAKLKKMRKEAKKQAKNMAEEEEVQQNPQAAVLAEVEKELTAEEANESKKFKLAELGTDLLTDPESNIKSLKEMLEISKDADHTIAVLGLKSLLAVFKDIIPGYRVRLPTEKEQQMVVSKAVKKMRYYESTLLSVYKAYLQRLIALEKNASFHRVAIRCICTLLDAVPHFNFRESLLAAVIKNISSPDEVIRKLCSQAVKSLFTSEGKHGGEATVEAVKLIAEYVKAHECQLHPDSIEVFLSLSFDEDLRRNEMENVDNKMKNKKNKKRKNFEEPSQLQQNDKKKSRKELMSKTRDEVNADFKAASFTQDAMERRRMQTETLSAVFQTYFRILKHAMQLTAARDQGEVLAETLKIMLCDDRQHDMQRTAAFVKRLATFSLCFGSAESMAALVTVRHLLQKNVKCRNLLENDAGGGSVSGSIAKFQPYASDPNLSGALASVLWELNLLSKHYHPAVLTLASNISTMSTAHNHVYHSNMSPQQAFLESSLEQESFNPKIDTGKLNNKRRGSGYGSGKSDSNGMNPGTTNLGDEGMVRKKLSEHFWLIHDINKNKQLRGELDRTTQSLQLYEQYKKQKKVKKDGLKLRKVGKS